MLSRECELLLRNCGFEPQNGDQTVWQASRFQIKFYRDHTYYTLIKELRNRKKIEVVSLYNDLAEDMDFALVLFKKAGVFRKQGEGVKQ